MEYNFWDDRTYEFADDYCGVCRECSLDKGEKCFFEIDAEMRQAQADN